MKKILESLFVVFFVVFMGTGAKFLWQSSQPNPDAINLDKETKAIQDRIDQSKKQKAQEAIDCERIASQLIKLGKLSTIQSNPACIRWTPSAQQVEQNTLLNGQKAAQEFTQSIDMVVAVYTDRQTAIEKAYSRMKLQRNTDLVSGQITEGQHNYFKETDKISHLEKLISNKQQMILAMTAEINKRVDVDALYAKYNIPIDAGAETLKAISNRIPEGTERVVLSSLSKAQYR